MGAFDDLIPGGKKRGSKPDAKRRQTGGAFDDLIPEKPNGANQSDFARLITGRKKEPSTVDQLKRTASLGGRSIIRGVYDITGLLGGDLINAAESKIRGVPVRSQRENADWLSDKLGLARPETAEERISDDVSSALVGSGGLLGIGRSLAMRGPGLAQSIGNALSSAPRTQIASTVAGSGASSVTREQGGGVGAQTIAGLAGGLSPMLGNAAGAMTVRGLFRGGEVGRQRVRQNIDDFAAVGATPTAGQATENPGVRGIEWFLSRLPGSANVILRKAEGQQAEIGRGTGRLAQYLSSRRSAADAGRAIEQGVRDDFVPRTRAVESRLYDTLDQHIPPNTHIPVANTQHAFGVVNQGVPGAPLLSQSFRNARLSQLEDSFLRDAAPAPSSVMPPPKPALPYEAVKRTRTQVGREIDNTTLASDVPRSMWNPIYGGLSDDLGAAARATGSGAEAAWQRANAYSRARAGRLDSIDHVVNAGTPEKVFAAATSGTSEGATTIRAVLRSLPQAGKRQVAATVLQRMGRAANSQQDELGEVFSTQTFLTNWNKLHPEARSALFGGFGPRFTENMNKLAKVASNLRTGMQMYANPSGTNAAAAQFGGRTALVASIASALMGGSWVIPLGTVASGVVANLVGRRLVNPQFVEWLARSTEIPMSALPQQVVVLRQIADRTDDPEVAQIADLLEQANQAPAD